MTTLKPACRYIQLFLVKDSPFHDKFDPTLQDVEQSYILSCEGLDGFTDSVSRDELTIKFISSIDLIVPDLWSYQDGVFKYTTIPVDVIVASDDTVWVTETTCLRICEFDS